MKIINLESKVIKNETQIKLFLENPEQSKEYNDLQNLLSEMRKQGTEYIKLANQGDHLFPAYIDLFYLAKPHDTIVIPIFLMWICLGYEQFNEKDLNKLWLKIRGLLKTPKIKKFMLQKAKFENLNEKIITKCKKIIEENPDGTDINSLMADSAVSTYFYLWVKKGIEYYEIIDKISKTSIGKLTDQIKLFESLKKNMEKIYTNYLKKYDDKV